MKATGYLTLCVFLVAPLHAQFQTTGCPAGTSGPQLNGFTAGNTAPSQICLTGSFNQGSAYNVGLFSPLGSTTITGVQASSSLMVVTVPASFYAAVSYPGQPDQVLISLTPGNQTGSFQINPPLQAGGPVFVSADNTPFLWTLYSGGTPPYSNQFDTGSVPTGMPALPASATTWSGTPNQSGVFQFTITPTDAWGYAITENLAAYVTPKPALSNAVPSTTVVGPGIPITLNGSGFVSPISIAGTAEPGSTVYWTQGSSITVILTPSSYSANQLTVNLPAGLLTATGYYALVVVNPGPNGSNGLDFSVTPSISALSTYTRTVGAAPFQLTVTGTGFTNGSVVVGPGEVNFPTNFVSSTVLTATFPSESKTGSVPLLVVNPDGTESPLSSAAAVTILPAPTVSALRPSSVNAGSPAFSLTVVGTQFLSGMTVYFNSAPLPTTLVLNQQNNMLTANVSASAVATAGTVPVYVGTADGYLTQVLSFTIISTTPPLQFGIQPVPVGVVNTAYTYTFAATGGVGGYTFSLANGTLPPGLQLSNGVLNGTPTAIGSFSFTMQVTDTVGNNATSLFTVNIAPQPLQLTTGPLANTQVNTLVSVQFAGSGGVPPYTFVEIGALPPGVSISTAGLLSGTPTRAGTYPFLLFIDDTTGASASKKFTLNVAVPGLLITPASPLPGGQINQPYTTQLAATGGVGAPYVWYATGLPNGLTMASNSGLIAGIPRASGTFTVAVTVGDSSGATESQNYSLTIASATLTVITPSAANGAVGSSYTAAVSASGGSGAYTFAATGLPPGVTLSSSGALSGTPTTSGSYTVTVTATDSTGLTATASFGATVTAKLVVTAATIPNAIVGTAISAVQLAATGGTPPYQWQSASLPPGLSLALNGTLSGTPTAAGTFSSTVYVLDSNGALSSGAVQVTVGLPASPPATISGLPASSAPATQSFLGISLANPYPATVVATLTLKFAPTSGADDPAIQFATGGRTAQIVVPAGDTVGLTQAGVQTGTVAGTITVTAQLMAGTVNVTPTPAPSESMTVSPSAPVITSVSATRTSTGFTVLVTGYASNRDVDSGAYQFAASEGANLVTTQLSTAITPLFTTWYGNSSSAPYGSQFTLTQPFTVSGSTSSVLSVTVTLTNALGTSPAATAILQ